MVWQLAAAAASAYGQYRANKATRNYLTGMSNTGYQRAMSDMRAAGLNPILAGKLGPASTPNYTAQNIGEAFNQGYSQASTAKQSQAGAELSNVQARAAQINADIAETSPKAVVSKIIKAIEDGLSGNESDGPYGAISEITTNVVLQSNQYKLMIPKGSSFGRFRPRLTEKLVAEVLKEASKFGINISAELMEMAINELMGK